MEEAAMREKERVGSPLTLVRRPPRKITVKSLLARRGSFILKRYPHWNQMVRSCSNTPDPVTECEKKLAAQMLEILEACPPIGAASYVGSSAKRYRTN
jgi:hypothetical protein